MFSFYDTSVNTFISSKQIFCELSALSLSNSSVSRFAEVSLSFNVKPKDTSTGQPLFYSRTVHSFVSDTIISDSLLSVHPLPRLPRWCILSFLVLCNCGVGRPKTTIFPFLPNIPDVSVHFLQRSHFKPLSAAAAAASILPCRENDPPVLAQLGAEARVWNVRQLRTISPSANELYCA